MNTTDNNHNDDISHSEDNLTRKYDHLLHYDWDEVTRNYYDTLGEAEWQRLDSDIAGRVSFEVHKQFLERFIRPGMNVLEIGAGPGRFTIELARMKANIVVTDYSPVQLELNKTKVGTTEAENNVVNRKIVNVCDTSEFADDQFDAVVAYGGPLSYAFDRVEDALQGLFRITKPSGVVVASVMSILGTWRYIFPAITKLDIEIGGDVVDDILATGDSRFQGEGHRCKMFRSEEIFRLVHDCGGTMLATSASNWASMNFPEVLSTIAEDPQRWKRFLSNEIAACTAPGALDGGTHILLAAIPGQKADNCAFKPEYDLGEAVFVTLR